MDCIQRADAGTTSRRTRTGPLLYFSTSFVRRPSIVVDAASYWIDNTKQKWKKKCEQMWTKVNKSEQMWTKMSVSRWPNGIVKDKMTIIQLVERVNRVIHSIRLTVMFITFQSMYNLNIYEFIGYYFQVPSIWPSHFGPCVLPRQRWIGPVQFGKMLILCRTPIDVTFHFQSNAPSVKMTFFCHRFR